MKVSDLELRAGGHRLVARVLGDIVPGQPTLVFLHGGLDCIAMWRGLPEALVVATGLPGLVYERWGHGGSDPLELPKVAEHRLHEAGATLGDVLAATGVDAAVLVGHSYGGCLALLAAALHPGVVRAAVAIAPQLVMHEVAQQGLAGAIAAWESGKLRVALEKYHGANTDSLFQGWISETADHRMEARYRALLEQIARPVAVVVGDRDEYGYLPNLELVAGAVAPQWRRIEVVPGWRHHPHWHDLAAVTECIATHLDAML